MNWIKIMSGSVLVFVILTLTSCKSEIVFEKDKESINYTIALDRENVFIVTDNNLINFCIQKRNANWEIPFKYKGDIISANNEKIYIISSQSGLDFKFLVIDAKTGTELFNLKSDSVSMYDLLVINDNENDFCFFNGKVLPIQEKMQISEDVFLYCKENKEILEWFTRLLRYESKSIEFSWLKRSLEIMKNLGSKENIRYISVNKDYLVLEFKDYFNYYNLESGEFLGKFSNDSYDYKRLRANYIFEVNNKRLINLESKTVEELDTKVNDVIFLNGERLQVQLNQIIKQ